MKKNIIKTILTSSFVLGCVISLSSCDLFGGNDEKVDAKLYHLTLTSNKTLSASDKEQLKATYGYGEPSPVVKEGVRDEGEIEELKKAGATDADIEKAGKRQSDGSYYFFEQDPIYIEAPKFEGYKLTGFYDKATNKLEYNPILYKDEKGDKYLTRWNMLNKDTELEARFDKVSYHPYFNNSLSDEVNPNILPDQYCFVDQGKFNLLPASSTNKSKTFKSWYYEKYVDDVWTKFYIDSLPIDYLEDSLRIQAEWEYKKIKINLEFELYVDPTQTTKLEWDDVVESINIKGNLTTVDGVPTVTESTTGEDKGLELKKDSVLEIQGTDADSTSWLDMWVNVKPEYEVWRYQLNHEGDYKVYYNYLDMYYTDLNGVDEATITFQLSAVI